MKSQYKFTEDWFSHVIPVWQQITNNFFLSQCPSKILEIGCYEGRATTWLCENVIKESNVDYDVIDWFEGSLEETGTVGTSNNFKQNKNFIQENFFHNISFHKNVNFNIHKGDSHKILPTFDLKETYDLIYVDASHRADDTFVDGYYCNKLLNRGGLIIFDDYGWSDPKKNNHPLYRPGPGIDFFCRMYQSEYTVVAAYYQVVLRKNT